jgi:Nif-specific regulatory protein
MPASPEVAQTGTFESRITAYAYEMIVDALKASDGNMSEAAQMLGLTRRILGLRMKEHGINYKDFRVARQA